MTKTSNKFSINLIIVFLSLLFAINNLIFLDNQNIRHPTDAMPNIAKNALFHGPIFAFAPESFSKKPDILFGKSIDVAQINAVTNVATITPSFVFPSFVLFVVIPIIVATIKIISPMVDAVEYLLKLFKKFGKEEDDEVSGTVKRTTK